MDKEKILSKAQSEKVDERYTSITDKSIVVSYISTILFISSLAIWNYYVGEKVLVLGIVLLFQTCVFTIYQYIKLKERLFYLYISVILVIILITSLIVYVFGLGEISI